MNTPCQCPDPELLAGFLGGSLSGSELNILATHLHNCETCRTILRELVAIDKDSRQSKDRAKIAPAWLAIAAAVTGLSALLRLARRNRETIPAHIVGCKDCASIVQEAAHVHRQTSYIQNKRAPLQRIAAATAVVRSAHNRLIERVHRSPN
jgi:hypothetical protein